MLQQFHQPANAQIHRETTAEEIWEDTDGRKVDIMVAGVGTGGTIVWQGNQTKPEFQTSIEPPSFDWRTSGRTKSGHWCWVYSQVLKLT